MTETANHLTGPWAAVISHQGESYDSIRTALAELGQDGEVDISVRRGTALAHEDDDGYLPGSYRTADVAYELDDVYLVDPDDPSVGAEARFAQAQAMAAGLNAADSWVVAKVPHDEDEPVTPNIIGAWIHRSAGQSGIEHTRKYAAQLLAAADELERRQAAEAVSA